MRRLYIDIETIPDNLAHMPQLDDLEFYTEPEPVKVPGNYKTEKAINNWETNKRPLLEDIAAEKALRQTQEKYEKALPYLEDALSYTEQSKPDGFGGHYPKRFAGQPIKYSQ